MDFTLHVFWISHLMSKIGIVTRKKKKDCLKGDKNENEEDFNYNDDG